ncbi:glycosyltransferase family 4 protein [Miltoncostaea oceani]|uniref:glycosyltransferase family 4 protein n=1 Tax=Miltoncostaea oceani TaxID=2843216 RepID=UPI001C3D99FA|nr:glycosyltransferase family 4 protein [Miltoncostaea oceani]
MSTPRALTVTIVEFQPRGALPQHAGQMADALAARGHDVEVLTSRATELTGRLTRARLTTVLPAFDPGARLLHGWLTPLQRAGRGLILVRAWLHVARHVRRHDPDIVQLGDLRTLVDGLGATWVAASSGGTAVVDMCHNVVPFDRRPGSRSQLRCGPLLRVLLGRAYRRMDAVLVHGDDSRRRFAATWRTPAEVAVVPHGDERIFGGPLPPANGPPTILFYGSWAGYKGIDVLLDAFARVRVQVPDARLELAGVATREITEEWVAERCRQFGDAVRAVSGYVSVEDTRAVFARASVVALPYREGYQSGVVFLALALGRPVVGTRVGDIGATIDASGVGIAVPPGDAAAFAGALITLLTDPERAAAHACAGRRWVTEESSWEIAAQRAEAVYRRVKRTPRVT